MFPLFMLPEWNNNFQFCGSDYILQIVSSIGEWAFITIVLEHRDNFFLILMKMPN